MFKFVILLSACLAFCISHKADASGNQIQWQTDYKNALEQSKTNAKPLVLFFTGSDWCSWCTKLEKEALDTQEFADLVGDKMIFVKVDFPRKKKLDGAIKKQNDELKTKFNIHSFPTLVIIDSNEKQIGTTGYRAGGGKQYAQHLLNFIKEYSAYKQLLDRSENEKLSGKDLKRLYQKAQEMGRFDEANNLIRLGIESNQPHFFMIEQYRQYVYEGKGDSPEALKIKEKIYQVDPENKNLCHYHISVIDFENLSDGKHSPDQAVVPLVNYINKFGRKDGDNLWRLQMLVSQVYLQNQRLQEALQYARESLESAPNSAQTDIALAIEHISTNIASDKTREANNSANKKIETNIELKSALEIQSSMR